MERTEHSVWATSSKILGGYGNLIEVYAVRVRGFRAEVGQQVGFSLILEETIKGY